MLQEYTISDLLSMSPKHIAYYANSIEAFKEPELEWPYRQSFYSMVWFTKGKGFNVIDFNEYQIRPKRMFLVNPDQINNWSYTHHCKGYILMFAKSLASQLNIEFSKPFIDIENRNAPLLKLVFENLNKDCQLDKDDLQHKIITSIQYLYSLITDKIHHEVFPLESTNHIFHDFKELILTRDFKIQSMNKYADALHISTTALNTICQDFTGISAKQLLLDLKITEAKRLLLYSNLNINEISFRLGFEESSYFARIFKKKTSLSPTQFQGKYR